MTSLVFDMTHLAVYLKTVVSALQRSKLEELLAMSALGRSTSDYSLPQKLVVSFEQILTKALFHD